jgi:hypothetical protein
MWRKGEEKIEDEENILDYRYPLSVTFEKNSERMFIGDSLGAIYEWKVNIIQNYVSAHKIRSI